MQKVRKIEVKSVRGRCLIHMGYLLRVKKPPLLRLLQFEFPWSAERGRIAFWHISKRAGAKGEGEGKKGSH